MSLAQSSPRHRRSHEQAECQDILALEEMLGMPFVVRPAQPSEDARYHEYLAEVFHELRLPEDATFPTREQAEEAAYMLKERTGVKWEAERV